MAPTRVGCKVRFVRQNWTFFHILGTTLLVSLLHGGHYAPHEWAPLFSPRTKTRFPELETRVDIMFVIPGGILIRVFSPDRELFLISLIS